MVTKVSYYEKREHGDSQIEVQLDASNPQEVAEALTALRGPRIDPSAPAPDSPLDPNAPTTEDSRPPEAPIPIPAAPPAVRTPYFDVGKATGKAGESVWVTVDAGCLYHMDGFHIGGGVGLLLVNGAPVLRASYGKFRATQVRIGDYLAKQLAAQEVIHTMENAGHEHDHYWSSFQFFDAKKRPLPEEFWEFALAGFSIDQRRTIEPFTIPSGTELFQLKIEILPGTEPGEYLLTCADERYYTQSHQRRRDYTYTFKPQGFTKIDTYPGKLTVVA